MRLSYALPNRNKLIIPDNVVARLLSYRQKKKRHKEAGGFLVGRHLLENNHLVVDQITEPGWGDRRFRSFFYRSNKHNKLVYNAWTASNKTETLIGLWHTHPEPVPNPSGVDWEDWRRALLHGDYVGSCLVFMIVGSQQIRIWQGDRYAQFRELAESINTDKGL